jgi:hypothetical protein
MTISGGGYNDRLSEMISDNVDCIPGGAETDALTSLEAPGQVIPGSVQVLKVGYSATVDRDIKVRFIQNKAPYFVYGSATYMVPRGSVWTVDIEVAIADNAPLATDGYAFHVRLLPHEGLWSERLGELIERDVDCVDTLVSAVHEQKISGFNLQQNFPNPFTHETRISYTIPDAGFVRLDIYDMQGRMVNCLVNEHRAAGEYSEIWDASNENGSKVPEGIYLCRISYTLNSGTFSDVRMMQLIK